VRVTGDRLAELLRRPPDALTEVEVTSAPSSWPPLKPLLVRFIRAHRERGLEPPRFGGVPICLFGSEWPGFPSRPRKAPARGRCVSCGARHACGFDAAVPDPLPVISDAPLATRWRDYGAAFRHVTGSDDVTAATPFLERIVAAYRGPVSLEPSVLLSSAVEPSARFVVFPHRVANGPEGAAESRAVIACVRTLLTEIGADPCTQLLDALAPLPPMPMPVGLDGHAGRWRLKMYLRLEDRTPAEKHAVLDAIARSGAVLDAVALPDLQMLGLVLDEGGIHIVKAYVAARPSRPQADGMPPPLAADHLLVRLTGDRALATLDVWCRGARRANKWDFNLRDHFLAGPSAERLVTELGTLRNASRFHSMLVGPTYRADIVAIGVRAATLAVYMELN
jgi:hypothetical protein